MMGFDKHDVFISYSTKNSDVANKICYVLEQNNLKCWIAPRNIISGRSYVDEIADAIISAKIVVLVFSQYSQESKYVNNEINLAFSHKKPILSFNIDNSLPKEDMQYNSNVIQWLPAYPNPEDEFKTLVLEVLKWCHGGISIVDKKIKQEIQLQNSEENFINDKVFDKAPTKKIRNFKYLDDLIHNGVKEIVLDSNIVLEGREEKKYLEGIKLDVDDLIIDGNGYTIDAQGKTRIFYSMGKNITIKNIKLKNGFAVDGGAIFCLESSSLEINNCIFIENTVQDDGGAIANLGKINIENVSFTKNIAKENAGAIANLGKINIENVSFTKNIAKENAGAVGNDGYITISNSFFSENTAKENGGIIANYGDAGIVCCKFQENTAKEDGGAIINIGKLSVTKTLFNKNTAKGGGAINNLSGSFLKVDDCDFKSNTASNAACIYNESDNVKIIDSIFSNNNHADNLIFNKNNMNILGCTFESNENMDCIISSAKESRLTISGGKIKDNTVKKSTIHTEAVECSVSSTAFKNNIILSSNSQCGVDILNEAKLSIQSPKITDNNAILNKGHVDVRKLSHNEVERIIHNVEGASIDEFIPPSEDKFDFTYLNNIIQNGSDGEVIVLNEDISLENYELDFHEGGIDLDKDNLTIDGDNHFIDGKHKTRIFNITGKNITLKNIIFKNGLAMNLYDLHTDGGGAIRIAKNANLILINCEFIDNISQDDGGVILNNGIVQSENNKFISNSSEYNGGAIQNNNILSTTNDTFENNASKIAGAIYNNHKLTIKKDITLINNSSNLKKGIYNANQVITEDIIHDVEKLIFNTHNINIDENMNEWQTFQYLNEKLTDSHSILDENIKIKFNDIGDDVILIDNVELDGKDHIIDLNHMNIKFKIRNDATIKNLTLKNALISNDSLFEIEGILRLENVKFLNNKIKNNCHLLNNHGTVEVIDSHFYNNNSKNNSLINNNNNLKITNTDFINNHSNSQGSIINNIMDNKGKVLIEYSLFQYNSTTKFGGTIKNGKRSVVEISNSKFIKNTAKVIAGAILNSGKLSVTETLFRGNSTQGLNGGAIHSSGGDVDISGCQFKENTAKEDGGAIFNFGKLSLTETMFVGNSTQRNGGAINNQESGFIDASNIEFNQNTANKNGGAIFTIVDENLNLKDCTFKDNKPDDVY